MKECWINVYIHGKNVMYGLHYYSKAEAILYASSVTLQVAYRIHVRLK